MKREIIRGASWVFLARLVDRALGFLSTLILARLLVPADFGLVVMAMAVIAVLELVTAFGFEVALIQHAEPSRAHYDTAWTLNFALATGCALLVLVLAYPAAAFFREDRLVSVMAALAACQVLGGAENVAMVDYRRRMDFRVDFRFMAWRRIAGFVVTLLAALTLQSYWALVIGTFATRASGVALSFAMHPFRPRFGLSKAGELFRFSRWTLLSNIAIAGIQRLPHFYAGRAFGPEVVGIYAMSYDLGTMAATELAAPVNRAAMPGYARLNESPQALKATFLDIGSLVILVALPLGVGVAALAEPLVELLLGQRWADAVPFIQILSIAGVLTAATANNGMLVVAGGLPSRSTWTLTTRLACLGLLVVLLAPALGPIGLAWAELGGTFSAFVASCVFAFGKAGVSTRDYAARNWRALAAALSMAVTLRSLPDVVPGAGPWLAAKGLMLGVPIGATVYVATLLILWQASGRPPGSEATVLARLRNYLPQHLRFPEP